ncbi:hypothetical protein COB57_03250 [Candidatus Peregrinibacteria bacterium]|nr:MAG: hypothetical protein COB57_03250 [Candidatus Peregrinibacteria bacterium]
MIPGLDSKTSQYVKCGFFRDKKSVYYIDKILPNVDPVDFEVIKCDNDTYIKNRDSVYYIESSWKNIWSAVIILGADRDTFQYFRSGISRDKHNIYIDGKKVSGVSPEDFEVMMCEDKDEYCDLYFKNTDGVFYRDGDKVVRIPGIDTASAVYLQDKFLRDTDGVYFYHHRLLESGGYMGAAVSPADFKILGGGYFTYKDNGYFGLEYTFRQRSTEWYWMFQWASYKIRTGFFNFFNSGTLSEQIIRPDDPFVIHIHDVFLKPLGESHGGLEVLNIDHKIAKDHSFVYMSGRKHNEMTGEGLISIHNSIPLFQQGGIIYYYDYKKFLPFSEKGFTIDNQCEYGEFVKDNKQIYSEGSFIKNPSPDLIEAFRGRRFTRAKDGIYFLDADDMFKKVEGADIKTFDVTTCNIISHDKKNVFFKNIKLDGITAHGFVNFNDMYLKDNYGVYYRGEKAVVKIPGADPKTMTLEKGGIKDAYRFFDIKYIKSLDK